MIDLDPRRWRRRRAMPWDDLAGIFDDDPDGDGLHAEHRARRDRRHRGRQETADPVDP